MPEDITPNPSENTPPAPSTPPATPTTPPPADTPPEGDADRNFRALRDKTKKLNQENADLKARIEQLESQSTPPATPSTPPEAPPTDTVTQEYVQEQSRKAALDLHIKTHIDQTLTAAGYDLETQQAIRHTYGALKGADTIDDIGKATSVLQKAILAETGSALQQTPVRPNTSSGATPTIKGGPKDGTPTFTDTERGMATAKTFGLSFAKQPKPKTD